MSTAAIQAFVSEPAIAIVGASRSGRKFGDTALRTLRDKGIRVYPIHPSAEQVDGTPCYRTFSDLPEPVAAVLIVVPPSSAEGVVREAAAAGIKKVWLQQGAESPSALATARALGLDVISGECVLMYVHPTGVHHLHAAIHRLAQHILE